MILHSIFNCNTDFVSELTVSGTNIFSNKEYLYSLTDFSFFENIFTPIFKKNTDYIEIYLKTKTNANINEINFKDADKISNHFLKNSVNSYCLNVSQPKMNIFGKVTERTIDTFRKKKYDVVKKNHLYFDYFSLDLKRKMFTFDCCSKTNINCIFFIGDTNNINLRFKSINTQLSVLKIIKRVTKFLPQDILLVNVSLLESLSQETVEKLLIIIRPFFKIYFIEKKMITFEIFKKMLIYSNKNKLYFDQKLIDSCVKNNFITTNNSYVFITKNIENRFNLVELSYLTNLKKSFYTKELLKSYSYNILSYLDYIGIKIDINEFVFENRQCSISLEPLNNKNACKLGCGHCFTTENIFISLCNSKTCPLCRQKISTISLSKDSICKTCSKLNYIIKNCEIDDTLIFENKKNLEFFVKLTKKGVINVNICDINDNSRLKNNLYVYDEEISKEIIEKQDLTHVKTIFLMKNIS